MPAMLNPARSTMRGTIPIAHADHDTHKTLTHCVLLLYALTTCGYAESRAKRRTSVRRTTLHIVQCNIAGPMFCDCAHPVPCSANGCAKWVCKNRSYTRRPPARRTVSHGRRASASRASASRASASRVSASRASASRGLLGPKMALPAGH